MGQDCRAGANEPEVRRDAQVGSPRVAREAARDAIPKSVNIKVLDETADTYYIVIPAFAKEGAELSDSDLEKVAGGSTVKGNASCDNTQGCAIGVTVVDVKLV